MLRPALSISLYVAGKRVLVVSGDGVAADRTSRLRAAGAEVEEVSAARGVTIDLAAYVAVFAHSGDRDIDRQIAETARTAGALAYAHDQPEISDFAMPALVTRGPLSIAISTSAAAPALSRRLREELSRVIERDATALDELIAELIEARQNWPRERRGELYGIASRLCVDGRLRVGE